LTGVNVLKEGVCATNGRKDRDFVKACLTRTIGDNRGNTVEQRNKRLWSRDLFPVVCLHFGTLQVTINARYIEKIAVRDLLRVDRIEV